jgi:hypothetical protein
MLALKCAACKKKLWRYDKIGPGEVLRCHKDRIIRMYASIEKLMQEETRLLHFYRRWHS